MSTKEIIDEILSLPIEKRAIIADSLLKSLSSTDVVIDNQWFILAKQRLNDMRSSNAMSLVGDEVFKRIRENKI